MSSSRKATTYLRFGFAALLIFSAAQVSYWILDQWWLTDRIQAERAMLHGQQIDAARRLLESGFEEREVQELFPDLSVASGRVEIDPEVSAGLAGERLSRRNRYMWEGGFFFAVLLASIAVIAQALRHDAELRRRQENFLAAVSHELKSPLASARIAAETLELRDPPAEQRHEQVGRILRNVGRLERMIGNLLATVRIEEGELALKPRRLELSRAIDPVVAALGERAADAGVALQLDVPGEIAVLADEVAVRTVLRNLLENALQAVAEADSPVVRVTGVARRDGAELAVGDNGRGFAPKTASRLFDKFYRPGDEMQRGGTGAGLGLHIVRELMTRSGGSVNAHSDGPGRGARFVTVWPLAAGE